MMKRFFLMLMLAIAFSVNADAQGWLNRLKDKAVDAAKNAVERNVENKAVKEADDASDAVLNKKKGSKKSKGDEADLDEAEDDDTPVDAKNQKSDFVRGSVILFEDDFAGEQMGEFPSKWDISDGSLEVASVNGKKYAHSNSSGTTVFSPLMQNMKSYLPDVFTLEWEEFMCKPGDIDQMAWHIYFYQGDDELGNIYKMFRPGSPDVYGNYSFKKGSGASGEVTGDLNWEDLKKCVKFGQWNHFAISFNKRAFKYYINGQRVINLPNVAAPSRFEFHVQDAYPYCGIGHVILAKGAVDLYQRQTTDLSAVEKAIAETGKFVTNNILFETGKATLKPESMAEIQKVADYMKKNPTARFEVQGHTDNQGSDKINDPLSQQRAEAVVKALEGLGCDPFNMRAVGKGSHEPVADNATEAGRAKNRRVEFIKK
jgi:outer membrane protein OmpA-like peptidoglycan-associated protein